MEHALALAHRLRWQIEVLADAGHLSMLEVSETFLDVVLRWLGERRTVAG